MRINSRLFCLLPLAYIVWWFYALVTWLIPAASTPIAGIVNATWWGIISVILFSTVGLFVLIAAFVVFFLILLD